MPAGRCRLATSRSGGVTEGRPPPAVWPGQRVYFPFPDKSCRVSSRPKVGSSRLYRGGQEAACEDAAFTFEGLKKELKCYRAR